MVGSHLYNSPDEQWSLSDFLAEIENAASRIPEERRSDAIVNLEGGYDESTILKITYTDFETDEEVDRRVRRFLKYRAEWEERDLQTFKRLKAKYGA